MDGTDIRTSYPSSNISVSVGARSDWCGYSTILFEPILGIITYLRDFDNISRYLHT